MCTAIICYISTEWSVKTKPLCFIILSNVMELSCNSPWSVGFTLSTNP